jgi:tetratricopeptide (TPR) repeat protein
MLCQSFANAGAGAKQFFLEEPKVVSVGDNLEITINFSTEIRYISHLPIDKADLLRVGIEIVNPCDAEEINTIETRWPSKANWYPQFKVTFPELIHPLNSTIGVCNATRSRVFLRHTLQIKFEKETVYRVRLGNDRRSIVLTVPSTQKQNIEKLSSPAPSISVVIPSSVDAQVPNVIEMPVPKVDSNSLPIHNVNREVAEITSLTPVSETMPAVDLLVQGKISLKAGDPSTATQLFNRLLNLPQNEYSQEAQQLVGLAREKNGDIDKAKLEYELYLKLYPQGDGATMVKKQLEGLTTSKILPTQAIQQKPRKPVKEIHQDTFLGSLSQYYYGGKSQTTSINGAGEVDKTNSTDQSALITNISATQRFRRNQYDTKIVFRDTQVSNFLDKVPDRNTISAAYIEHTNKANDYMFRVGKQSGTSQGVLGRFDGAFGRYGINPNWHITAVVGEPDNGNSQVQTKRHFYGIGLEFGPIAEKWSGMVYGIQQVADGLVERRALGTEMRYFNGTTSWFSMLDYDTVYSDVNIAMLQGNWQLEGGYNFNLLLDHRKSPVLYAETAIQGVSGARSVGDLRSTISSNDIYNYVKGLVPISDLAMLGVTKQVSKNWQVGGDLRYTKTLGTSGAGAVEAQPGSGTILAYTMQAIGNNTLFKNDTSVIMLGLINDPTYNSQNLSLVNSFSATEKLRIDSSLRYYQENRDTNAKTWKVTPGLRFNYYMRDNLSFELEMLIDYTHSDDPVSVTKTDTWRETIFAGYRWDIR